MMRRYLMVGIFATLGASLVWAQAAGKSSGGSPARGEYSEEASWSTNGPRKYECITVDRFGERVKNKVVQPPSTALALADEIKALTPQEGLARLEALGRLERMFTNELGPEERAAELDALATLTEEIDPGDRTFERAFQNYSRALNPFLDQISRETHSRLVCDAADYDDERQRGGDPFQSRLCGEPCGRFENGGKAWMDWVTEGMKKIERFSWMPCEDLPSMSCCGLLTGGDLNRLLRAAGPCLATLTPPGNPREQDRLTYLGDNLMFTLAGMPELEREDARTLMSLLCGMKVSGVEFASKFRNARRMLMLRFHPRDLYPEGIPKTVEACMADDMKRKRFPSKLEPPRHFRVSTWRFAPGAEPECLATASFETLPGVWSIQTWGEPTPLGAIAVRTELDGTSWMSLGTNAHAPIFNRWDPANWTDGGKVAAGKARYVLEQCLSVPTADGWRRNYGQGTTDSSIVEFSDAAFGDRLGPAELYSLLLTADIQRDYHFREAALGYLKTRLDPCVRELLLDCLWSDQANAEIRAQIAHTLLERHDWAAFDEMATILIKHSQERFPPLLDVFDEAAKPNLAPEEARLRWAKTIIRTQITPPMHPDNTEILLKLCGQFGSPDFRYAASDDEATRAAALRRARDWAE